MENIEFLVPEFEHREKSIIWYVDFGLIIAIFIIFAILTKTFIFIAVVVLGAVSIIVRDEMKPKDILLAIHDDGVYLGNKIYPYKEIKNYSIDKIGGQSHFTFTPSGRWQTQLRFQLNGVDSSKIRGKLNNLLTEVEYQESLLDAVVRLIGL